MKLSEEIKETIKENDCQCKICRNKKRIYENMLPKIEQLEKDKQELIKVLKGIDDKFEFNICNDCDAPNECDCITNIVKTTLEKHEGIK